jgi:enoyl-CoA hydratase
MAQATTPGGIVDFSRYEPYLRVEFDQDTRVATVILDRQDNDKNQINTGLIRALMAVLAEEYLSSEAKGLILISGKEKVFSTGADIDNELKDLHAAQAARFSRAGREVFAILGKLPCLTVACLSGFALGGGLELALNCDFRLAVKTARLGVPEINLGVIPGWGGTQRLPRLIGANRALQMILSGDPIKAAQAEEWGLVDDTVESYAELRPAAAALLAKYSAKSRNAIAIAKRAVWEGLSGDLAHGLNMESEMFALAWGTPDRNEGIAAYLAKRKPVWPE